MKHTMSKTVCMIAIVFVLSACAGKEAKAPEKAAQGGAAPGREAVLVECRTLAPQPFAHSFTTNGVVEAVREAFISPETNGQIARIPVREGQRVAAGQLLAALNADVIRSSIAEVKSNLELARVVYEKRRQLWEKKIGSEIQLLEAKAGKESLENRLQALQAQLDMANVTAPFAGVVDRIYQKEGELASPGVQLMQLVDLRRIRINAEISETYLSSVHPGDPVQLTFSAYPGMELKAAVGRVGQVVNPQNRTFLVQIEMDNPTEKFKPNMLAVLRIRDFYRSDALTVPAIVVKNDLQGSFLYVAAEENGVTVARKTYVETGLNEGGVTMITKGLAPGQRVIVGGYNLVVNGMPVRVKQ